MRPPLRELEEGRDFARSTLPSEEQAFLRWLGGPTLLRLHGRRRTSVRAVSTLLHANEPSGLRAMLRWLHGGDQPATDVLFFVGAVRTALEPPGFAHRALPGAVDANRCWRAPWDSPQGEVARAVLERLRSEPVECLVDVHNNTGHNPAYGVAFEIGHAEQSLVSLFADRVVHTPLRLGTLVEATLPLFPSVTIECGRAGDPVADEVAWHGLRSYLDWERIDFAQPIVPLRVLESPVRVCVREGVDLSFADAPDPRVPVTISKEIDRHNFEDLPVGTPIGWVAPGADWPLEAIGVDGRECSGELFVVEAGQLSTRRPFIPIMMTTNRVIAKSDCLFYAVQPAAD